MRWENLDAAWYFLSYNLKEIVKNRCPFQVQRAVQYVYLHKCMASYIRSKSNDDNVYRDEDEVYFTTTIYEE